MTDYKQTIWLYLLNKIGNEYGVAGLMGNLQAESNLQPNNLQNSYEISLGYTDESYTSAVDNGTYSKSSFVYDSAGYGLAQWTYWSRKQALYNKYKSGNYSSIGCIELALDYLYTELVNSYPSVLSVLKNADSIKEASDKVLHGFENPADQSDYVESYRASLGEAIYNECKNYKEFKPRLNSDDINGSFYYYDGNPFYQAGYGLPNCTCYAWGRFWEISDPTGTGSNKPTLPTGDAGTWYANVSGYEKGITPKLGAVICFSDPNGAGHVAIVEQILDNGDIVTSNSAWGGTYFYTQTIKGNEYGYYLSGYNFQGFIYNPYVFNKPIVTPGYDTYSKKKKKGFNWVLFNRQRKRF